MKAKISLILTLIFVVIMVGWDIYVQATGGLHDTESWAFWRLLASHPIIGILMGMTVGILLGHLAWNYKNDLAAPLPTDRLLFSYIDFMGVDISPASSEARYILEASAARRVAKRAQELFDEWAKS